MAVRAGLALPVIYHHPIYELRPRYYIDSPRMIFSNIKP